MMFPGNPEFVELYHAVSPSVSLSASSLIKTVTPREKDAVVAVLSENNAAVIVSAVQKIRVPTLNNNFFFDYQHHYNQGVTCTEIELTLIEKSIRVLEGIRNGLENPPVGILWVIRDGRMKMDKFWRQARWPQVNFVMMGFTAKGEPIFLRYFNGVRI